MTITALTCSVVQIAASDISTRFLSSSVSLLEILISLPGLLFSAFVSPVLLAHDGKPVTAAVKSLSDDWSSSLLTPFRDFEIFLLLGAVHGYWLEAGCFERHGVRIWVLLACPSWRHCTLWVVEGPLSCDWGTRGQAGAHSSGMTGR